MDYTLDSVYDYILEKADKKGSDFFQLPYVLNEFKSAVLDFIGERIPVIEATQQVTQDLQKIMLTTKEQATEDPDDPHTMIAQVPENCHYLFRVSPIFTGGLVSRKPRLVRHGDVDSLRSDPHNKPSMEYPLIVQYQDYVKIDSGYVEKPEKAYLTFLKKPEFAKASEGTKRIVDLPDVVIEDVILKVVQSLLEAKGDQRSETAYRKEQTFRNINR